MKERFRKSICVFLSVALVVTGIPYRASAVENGATVTTPEEFMSALAQKKSPIIVNDLITIGDTADASGRMLPVKIPADTEIRGEGTIAHLNSRAPIQLEGDASFHNLELTFESTDALGSVPHREIFLAGHGLTFDNVSTWLEGGNNEFGPISGTEEELLPTVYGGGFTNTDIGDDASLTVKNSNEKTMFQAVYMGHDAGNDEKVPYYGNAKLNLDSKLTVREKVDVSKNRQADISIAGGEYDTAKTKQFSGNENTTLTLSRSNLVDAVLENVGNLILTDNACLSPKSNTFNNVTLRRGGCLDLNGVSDAMNVIISGNFAGVSDPAEERGILVVNQQSSLIIEGHVSGSTQFQTDQRLFPGQPLLGWPYLSVNRENVIRSNFVLAQKTIDNYGYRMNYSNGLWTVIKPDQDAVKEIGSIEVASAPSQVRLDSIMKKLDGSVPDETVYFDIIWKDVDGNVISAEEADERMLYEIDCVFKVKTEYWESDDPAVLSKTDWGNSISLMSSNAISGRYYLQAEAGAKAGDYTFLFCSDYVEQPLNTVQDVKNLGSRIQAEKRVTFLYPEPEETPASTISPTPIGEATPKPSGSSLPTEKPVATETPKPEESSLPTEKPVATETSKPEESPLPTEKPNGTVSPGPGESQPPDKKAGETPYVTVSPPEKVILSTDTMVYTGKPRKPEVTVQDASGEVISSENYQLSYSNNITPGQAGVTVSFCGAYTGTMKKTFQIVPKGTKLSGLSSVSKGFVARWKKQPIQTTGYELQYSTSKKFVKKGTKKAMVKGKKKVSRRITGSKPGKQYFVRIRTYKSVKINGRTEKFYSAWSKVKTVKTR